MRVLGFNTSRSTRILWALEEVRAEYEYVAIDPKSRYKNEELLRSSPLGKIPVLIVGDQVITETLAILTYIGHCYPESKLVPCVDDADYYSWLSLASFVVTEFEQPLWTKAKHTFSLPEELRHRENILPAIEWEFERFARKISHQLGEREYFLGGHFSACDILLAHTLGWAAVAKFPIAEQNLLSYRKNMFARHAFKRAKLRERETEPV